MKSRQKKKEGPPTTDGPDSSDVKGEPNTVPSKPQHSWRDFPKRIVVHPCADTFPRLEGEERDAFDRSIKEHRLKVPIQTREVAGEPDIIYVIDGRERLDSLERNGVQIVDNEGHWMGELLNTPGTEPKRVHRTGATHRSIATEVIDFNIRRRHHKLPKEKQLAQIAKVLAAAKSIGKTDEKEFPVNHDQKLPSKRGRKGEGRPRDPERAEVEEEAAKAGIKASDKTVRRALAKTKQQPESETPELDKAKELRQSDLRDVRGQVFKSEVLSRLQKRVLSGIHESRQPDALVVIMTHWQTGAGEVEPASINLPNDKKPRTIREAVTRRWKERMM